MGETEVFSRATSALAIKKDVTVTYTELDDFDGASGRPTHPGPENAVQAWPTQPKPLVLAQKEQVLWTIFDIALVTLPVCLMVKIGLCIYAHHSDKDNAGVYIDSASLLSRGLIRLNEQLVTLFTIVFMTIMSTFVKRYALWKAQHGACVSDLEQFQGSVSLPSTLKLIWSLRSFGLNSLVLATAWSFYYLGSQAVKLEYQLSLSDNFGPVYTVSQRSDAPSYFSPSLQELHAQWQSQNHWTTWDVPSGESYLERLNIKFGASILEQQESVLTTDGAPSNPGTSNGPIVPDYHWAQTHQPRSLTDDVLYRAGGWLDISQRSKQEYVSLAGHNLWGDVISYTGGQVDHDATTTQFLGTYTLHNISYLNVNCSTPIVYPASNFPNGTLLNSAFSFNMTSITPDAPKDRNGYPLRQLDYWQQALAVDLLPGMTPTDTVPSLNDSFGSTLRAFQMSCNLTTSYVDMQIGCLSTGCYVNRVRWADNTNAANATGYSTPFDNAAFAENFLNNFLLSTGNPQGNQSTTIVEGEFLRTDQLDIEMVYWSALGPAHFVQEPMFDDLAVSQGLTQGFNTYYMLSQSVVTANILPNITFLQSSPDNMDTLFQLVRANGALLSQAYRIYWQWVPVDIMACSILLAAAIGAYWLRIDTLAPDIFGYVSSLTRDNPHIHLPTEGSALSGIDRARMLKGVKVKIADVQSGDGQESSIGRVGLVPLDAEVRPLHSNARYL